LIGSRLRIEDLEKGKVVPSCDVTPAAEHETQPTKQGIESTQNRKSEKWAVELEAAEAALEAELADFEKVRLQMADHISELEMQLESTTGECELQQQEASVLKNQVVSLVSEKEKLQSMLEQEVQQHRDVLLKLESELGAALEELETYKSTQLHLEERVGQLTGEVTVHVEANEELQKRAIAMEESLQRTMEQVEQLTGDVSSHVEAKEGLQKGVVDLEESLQRALEQVELLTGQVSYHLEAKQGLQKRTVELEESLQRAIGEVEQLTGEVSGQMEAKEALQKHIGELEENLEGAVQELEHLRGEVSHYEEANLGLQGHVEELEESLQKAVGGLATVAALEAQVTQLQSAYDEQGVRYNSEFERLTQLMEAERQKAGEALQQMSRENATAAEILQSEVAQLTKQLSSTQDRLLQAQDLFKEDDSTLQQHQLHDAEGVHSTHGEQNGPLSSNGKRILSGHLSGSNGEIKPLTNILDKHEAKDLVELQEKVLQLEGEVQSRSHKIESMIQDFEEKESLLLRKIAGLELAKEQIEEGAVSDLEQLHIEVTCSFVLSFG
jgi:chromosome segregation ATPase